MSCARTLRQAGIAAWASILAGCATPASDVKVPTLSMRAALERSHGDDSAGPRLSPAIGAPERDPANGAADTPRPIVTLPDVRLAWLYEWVDADGNRHFGSWVAIPVSPSRWLLSGGDGAPLDAAPPSRAKARAPSSEPGR